MSSEPRGIGASTVEVTNITAHGVWLLAGERELFMPYTEFPFFRDVSVGKILNVEQPTLGTSTGPTSMSTWGSRRSRIRTGFH